MITRLGRLVAILGVLVFSLGGVSGIVSAADIPDFTKFGYPTVAASMDIPPDQAVTITAGNQSVAIKAGTFDGPVTFALLTNVPSAWQNLASDRTVRAAFAFRVIDKATTAIVVAFKQPVTYTYSGTDAQSTDAILNTSATIPPAITPNTTPIIFDGNVRHSFGSAGGGWLVVSAPTGGVGTAAVTGPAGTSATIAHSNPLLATLLLLVTIGGAVLAAVMLVRSRPSA